jgi:hypothetical protein
VRHTRRGRTLLAAGIMAWAAPAVAQRAPRVDPSPAEIAISMGDLDGAEDALYEAVRRAPREPSARGALGAFLAARGRSRIGATLLEEAVEFGGDSGAVHRRLSDVWRWAGEYGRAGILRASGLSQGERDALVRAGTAEPGGAPTATVPMEPNDLAGLGRITLVIGSEAVPADITLQAEGLTLPATTALLAAVEPVGASGDTTFAVARQLTIGSVALGATPVMLVPAQRAARIGLDVLARVSPTFDHAARTLTVRTGRAPDGGEAWPLYLTFPGVSAVAEAGAPPVALHSAAGRAAIRGRRWTLDLDRGVIRVAR